MNVLLRDCDSPESVLKLHEGRALIIGRSVATKIKDPRVSRTQLCLTLNAAERSVLIHNIARNSSAVNGVELRGGQKRKAYDGDHIAVLSSKYLYKLEFVTQIEPAPPKIARLTQAEATPVPAVIWKNFDGLLIFTTGNIRSRNKIAAFDLAGTIIKTASGRVFPKDYDDWRISFPNVVTKLKELNEQGYKVVLFTNQGGIGEGRLELTKFKQKIENVATTLSVPIQAFISTKADIFRKPRVGMWQHLLDHENEKVEINVGESFYCGDAADQLLHCERDARFPYYNKKKDFLNSNRLFAMNVNLKFFTPKEYFADT